MGRSYSARTLKILWGRAAGRCAVPTCRIELFVEHTDHDPIVVIGDIAHIEAASNRGPRANVRKGIRARDAYDNLILLCKTCHARLDQQKRANTVERIRQLRKEHEAWVRANLPERGASKLGWTAVFLEGSHPLDKEEAVAALAPDFVSSARSIAAMKTSTQAWNSIYGKLAGRVNQLLRQRDPFDCRIAVFPLAPVSSCLALGYLLTNRPRTRLFQYHRDAQTWRWQLDVTSKARFSVSGFPRSPVLTSGDVAICFHISARIHDHQIAELKQNFLGKIDVVLRRPGTTWLRREQQLLDVTAVARQVFEKCSNLFPRADAWHLFCAVPAPVAVALGQQLNPTMSPPVQLYEFNRAIRPHYRASMRLASQREGEQRDGTK